MFSILVSLLFPHYCPMLHPACYYLCSTFCFLHNRPILTPAFYFCFSISCFFPLLTHVNSSISSLLSFFFSPLLSHVNSSLFLWLPSLFSPHHCPMLILSWYCWFSLQFSPLLFYVSCSMILLLISFVFINYYLMVGLAIYPKSR